MATAPESCPVCADPARYVVEQAYLERGQTGRYGRHALEAHLAHTVDTRALRQVSDLASASAVASRLRQLENLATAVIDVALAQDPPDGRLALAALREARATLVEMGRLSDALQASAPDESTERPDLDAAIARVLGVTMSGADESTPTHDPEPHEQAPLALPPGSPPTA